MRLSMRDFTLAFQYLNNPYIYSTFDTVNNRVRRVLLVIPTLIPWNVQDANQRKRRDLDHNHNLPIKLRPQFASWVDVYDTWMAQYLKRMQEDSQRWSDAVFNINYPNLVQNEPDWNAARKAHEMKWLKFHRDENQPGMFRKSQMVFGQGYEHIIHRPLRSH